MRTASALVWKDRCRTGGARIEELERPTRRVKGVDAAEWAGFFRALVWLGPVRLLMFVFTTVAAAVRWWSCALCKDFVV